MATRVQELAVDIIQNSLGSDFAVQVAKMLQCYHPSWHEEIFAIIVAGFQNGRLFDAVEALEGHWKKWLQHRPPEEWAKPEWVSLDHFTTEKFREIYKLVGLPIG